MRAAREEAAAREAELRKQLETAQAVGREHLERAARARRVHERCAGWRAAVLLARRQLRLPFQALVGRPQQCLLVPDAIDPSAEEAGQVTSRRRHVRLALGGAHCPCGWPGLSRSNRQMSLHAGRSERCRPGQMTWQRSWRRHTSGAPPSCRPVQRHESGAVAVPR